MTLTTAQLGVARPDWGQREERTINYPRESPLADDMFSLWGAQVFYMRHPWCSGSSHPRFVPGWSSYRRWGPQMRLSASSTPMYSWCVACCNRCSSMVWGNLSGWVFFSQITRGILLHWSPLVEDLSTCISVRGPSGVLNRPCMTDSHMQTGGWLSWSPINVVDIQFKTSVMHE